MYRSNIYSVLILFMFTAQIFSQSTITVKDALKNTTIVAYPNYGKAVNETVAKEFRATLTQNATIIAAKDASFSNQKGIIRVAISDENFINCPSSVDLKKDWMFFRLNSSGDGEIIASKSHLLYALFCQIKEDWLNQPVDQFENGKLLKTSFCWLRGEDGFYGMKTRYTRNYDPETSIKELARMGVLSCCGQCALYNISH